MEINEVPRWRGVTAKSLVRSRARFPTKHLNPLCFQSSEGQAARWSEPRRSSHRRSQHFLGHLNVKISPLVEAL